MANKKSAYEKTFHDKFEKVGGMRQNAKRTGWNLEVVIPPERAGEKIKLFAFKSWAKYETEYPFDFDVYITRLTEIEPTDDPPEPF